MDKKIDTLLKKQDIKLSESFNDSLFTQIKNADKEFDEIFSEQSLSLNSAFNDKVLDEARIESFLQRDTLKLDDSFCDSVFAKIEPKAEPKRNVWLIASAITTAITGIAALFMAGIFVSESPATKAELLPVGSPMYEIAEENITTEIDYFLLQDDMYKLSQEIDSLEASMIELESYSYVEASLNI